MLRATEWQPCGCTHRGTAPDTLPIPVPQEHEVLLRYWRVVCAARTCILWMGSCRIFAFR
jgi:hypothetical protein